MTKSTGHFVGFVMLRLILYRIFHIFAATSFHERFCVTCKYRKVNSILTNISLASHFYNILTNINLASHVLGHRQKVQTRSDAAERGV